MTVLSITGAEFNVRLRRGVALGPKTVTATYKSSGLPIPLTGATITCQVRQTYESAVVIATIVCTITDADAGQFTIELSGANSALIPAGDYVWDLIITEASGRPIPWWRGTFTITGRVTR